MTTLEKIVESGRKIKAKITEGEMTSKEYRDMIYMNLITAPLWGVGGMVVGAVLQGDVINAMLSAYLAINFVSLSMTGYRLYQLTR